MWTSSLFAFAVLTAMAASATIEEEWADYKRVWGKQYGGLEDTRRKAVWLENKKEVEAHNSRGLGYKLGLQETSDWGEEEIKARMGAKPSRSDVERKTSRDFSASEATPDIVDHRTSGLVTGVRNQGQCGSCWAFSATGAVEGVWASKVGDLEWLSEQQILDCSTIGDCDGGWVDIGFENARSHGQMTEEDYPYEAETTKECRFDSDAAVASITGFETMFYNPDVTIPENEKALENALHQLGHPISLNFHKVIKSYQHYSGGIYSDPECRDTDHPVGYHATLLVGYNKTAPEPYWIVKNSWGSEWGEEGYIHLKMGEDVCGIARAAMYPTLDI